MIRSNVLQLIQITPHENTRAQQYLTGELGLVKKGSNWSRHTIKKIQDSFFQNKSQ